MVIAAKLLKFVLFWKLCVYSLSSSSAGVNSDSYSIMSSCIASSLPLCTKSYECTVVTGQNLTFQCGEEHKEESCTYKLLWNNKNYWNSTILSHSDSLFLTINSGYNEHTVICQCQTSNKSQATTCYKLNVQYPPIQDQPIVQLYSDPARYREPFGLRCPIHSNPPANYSWVRYSLSSDGFDLEVLELPKDMVFEDNGQQWSVTYYDPSLHNGLYKCTAWNHLGNTSYSDRTSFFLNTRRCTYSNTGSSMMNIHPSGEVLAPRHSNVSLTCTVAPVERMRGTVTWYIEVNGSYVKPSSQEREYNESACLWSNTLTITNFSEESEGTYYCGFSNLTKKQTIALSEESAPSTSGSTTTAVAVVSSLVITIVVSIVIIAVVLKVYWKHKALSYHKYSDPPNEGYEYDIFISAHDEIRSLVEESILKPLENECSPPYRACWHHRDFIAGFNITEQIAECIHTRSRKIIFVFSEKFSTSSFCKMELQQAMHRLMTTSTRCIVPVTLSDSVVPVELKRYLTYWPVVHANDDSFVEKLAELIGHPISYTQSDEDHLMVDIPDALEEDHFPLL